MAKSKYDQLPLPVSALIAPVVDVSNGCQPGGPQTWSDKGMTWLALVGVLVGGLLAPLATTRFGWSCESVEGEEAGAVAVCPSDCRLSEACQIASAPV
jgi:hypothetical protein